MVWSKKLSVSFLRAFVKNSRVSNQSDPFLSPAPPRANRVTVIFLDPMEFFWSLLEQLELVFPLALNPLYVTSWNRFGLKYPSGILVPWLLAPCPFWEPPKNYTVFLSLALYLLLSLSLFVSFSFFDSRWLSIFYSFPLSFSLQQSNNHKYNTTQHTHTHTPSPSFNRCWMIGYGHLLFCQQDFSAASWFGWSWTPKRLDLTWMNPGETQLPLNAPSISMHSSKSFSQLLIRSDNLSYSTFRLLPLFLKRY